MQLMRRSTHATTRAGVLAAVALAACTLTPAHAADAADGIDDYRSAQQVLRTDKVKETVSRFLVTARPARVADAADGGMGAGPGDASDAPGTAPRFDLKDPVPMYEISRDFVTGKAGSDPRKALRLSFLASRVTAADGHKAAVLLSPKKKAAGAGGAADGHQGWQLSGVRDGDEELNYAEDSTSQTPTFTEPQIHAWYRLTASGLVEPLNKEARTGLEGKNSLPLTEYQKLVQKRYGDKLPGSEYGRKGMAGGYAGLTEAGRTAQPEKAGSTPQPQGHTARQAQATRPTPLIAEPWQLAALVGAASLITAGGVTYMRRRRTATEH
jgi:hypothetical protein